MIPCRSFLSRFLLGAILAGLLPTIFIHGQEATGLAAPGSGYTIYPLLKTGDAVHPGEDIWLKGPFQPVSTGPEGIVLQCRFGVYYATPERIYPILTPEDTIPGTGKCIDYFWEEGWSWSPGVERMYKFGVIDSHIVENGNIEIIFCYINERRINFYRASPGYLERLFDFPEKLMIGDVEYIFSDPFDAIWGLAYGEPQGRPTIGIFWHRLDLWVEKNNKIALFAYDGEKVLKLAANGDLVSGTGGKIRFIGEPKYEQQVRWNDDLTACYFKASCQGDNGYALYYADQGQITPVLRKDQPLTGSDEVPYRTMGHIEAWTADFTAPTAYICINNNDFITVTNGKTMRFPGWRYGDPLPEEVGGTILTFGITLKNDNNYTLLWHPFFVFPESERMVSWVEIKGSAARIKEGIFACSDGMIRKMVALGDATPADVGGTFKTFTDFGMTGENDLIFLATVTDGNAGSGIFRWSDGILSTVVTDASPIPMTDKHGQILHLGPEEVSITGFKTWDLNTVYFSASWTGGGGYFVARND